MELVPNGVESRPSKLTVAEEIDLRKVALAYATQVDTARIHAEPGLATEKIDTVRTAKAMFAFLTGGL